MKIKKTSADQFEIESGKIKIILGEHSKIGDLELSGPGEYEISNIRADGVFQNSYLFQSEGINLVYLSKNESLNREDLEKIDGVDILLLPVLEQNFAKEAVEQIDPKVVIPYALGDPSSFLKIMGVEGQTMTLYKINKNNLPTEEERKIIIL